MTTKLTTGLSLAAASLLQAGCNTATEDDYSCESSNTKATALIGNWRQSCTVIDDSSKILSGSFHSVTKASGSTGTTPSSTEGKAYKTELSFSSDGELQETYTIYSTTDCNANTVASKQYNYYCYEVGDELTSSSSEAVTALNIDYQSGIEYSIFQLDNNDQTLRLGSNEASSSLQLDGSSASLRYDGLDSNSFDLIP